MARVRLTFVQRGYPESHFIEVADVYREAGRMGLYPTAAVGETFNVKSSVAARWVCVARKKGLLAPTTRRRGAWFNARVVAVAKAIDVDPGALDQAIRDHADGFIRLW